jgi:hypothetical protein
LPLPQPQPSNPPFISLSLARSHTQTSVATFADKVLVLGANGEVLKFGTPSECESFFDRIVDVKNGRSGSIEEELGVGAAHGSEPEGGEYKLVENEKGGVKAPVTQQIALESTTVGKVTLETYRNYFRAGGFGVAELVLLLMALAQGFIMFSDYWLVLWATNSSTTKSSSWYFQVYCVLIFVTIVLAFVRTIVYFIATLRASSKLHVRMLERVIRAPMWWIFANPLGRVLNRFSADQGQVSNSQVFSLSLYQPSSII